MKVTRLYIRNLIKEVIAEADDKIHIGYGKYKDKGKEKDPNAQVYKKTDQGKFEPVGGDDGKGAEKEPDKPKITKIDANPFDPEKPADEPSDMDTERPDDEPEDDDTSMGQRNRSYGGRGFGEEPDPTEIDDALQGAEEGIYDALNRGMSYGEDRDVDRMIDDDILSALDAGATDEDLMDFADNLDGEGRQMFQDSLNNLAYDLDVIQSDFYNAPMGGRTGSTVNLSPSDPNYKSPGEQDTKGSDNPYDWEEPDDDDDNFYDEVGGADLDQTIDNAIDGIIPERREKAFELIVQGFDDDYDVKEMYSNLENNQIPKPDQDPFGAIQHAILMQGINDGTLDFGDTGMKLANYIETREEDLYDTIMGEGVYNLRKEFIEYNKYNKHLMKSFI